MGVKDIRDHLGEDLRRGLRVGLEDRAIGGLVALPFAGALGIWFNALTSAPNPVTWAITLLIWLPLATWIAGHLDRANAG